VTTATDHTARLDAVLTAEQAGWLAATCAAAACAAAGDDGAVVRAFPAVGRRLGRGPLSEPGPLGRGTPPAPGRPGGAGAAENLHTWTVDDAGRARLLQAVPPDRLAALVDRLYAHGDAAERRGVLRSLDVLALGDEGLPLLRNALRGNDVRLIAAAAGGSYAAARLPDLEFAHAVLKCLFVGVPLAGITGLPGRRDARLGAMVADFARELRAAGRRLPADCWLLTTPSEVEG
jgi:hypothetical protein